MQSGCQDENACVCKLTVVCLIVAAVFGAVHWLGGCRVGIGSCTKPPRNNPVTNLTTNLDKRKRSNLPKSSVIVVKNHGDRVHVFKDIQLVRKDLDANTYWFHHEGWQIFYRGRQKYGGTGPIAPLKFTPATEPRKPCVRVIEKPVVAYEPVHPLNVHHALWNGIEPLLRTLTTVQKHKKVKHQPTKWELENCKVLLIGKTEQHKEDTRKGTELLNRTLEPKHIFSVAVSDLDLMAYMEDGVCFRHLLVGALSDELVPVRTIRHILHTLHMKPRLFTPEGKIVVTWSGRGEAPRRHLENVDALLPIIQQNLTAKYPGRIEFNVVEFGALSFAEQVAIAANTSILMGVHGQNMANCAFQPNQSALLEIKIEGKTGKGLYTHHCTVMHKELHHKYSARNSPSTPLPLILQNGTWQPTEDEPDDGWRKRIQWDLKLNQNQLESLQTRLHSLVDRILHLDRTGVHS
eukprot:TRINITY_DN27295_c0_g1_i1.p1 TRINITY_DN27295_c0_g1~~TRINITY_DN27295_c0_g1_i1.p1  ORF type:complete len:462 (-),score=41.88 TRINITY_DN27295_c0_g1_i1:61-1446(-)